jgi:hypothetical protein
MAFLSAFVEGADQIPSPGPSYGPSAGIDLVMAIPRLRSGAA